MLLNVLNPGISKWATSMLMAEYVYMLKIPESV